MARASTQPMTGPPDLPSSFEVTENGQMFPPVPTISLQPMVPPGCSSIPNSPASLVPPQVKPLANIDFENRGDSISREDIERRPTLPKGTRLLPNWQGVRTAPVQWSLRGGADPTPESDIDSRSNFEHLSERSTVNIQSISKRASAILTSQLTSAIKELTQSFVEAGGFWNVEKEMI